MSKKDLSERDICSRYITPAIKDIAGWEVVQIFEEFTLGRISVRGKKPQRGLRERADYILFYKRNLPIAIIEAKDNSQTVGAGLQQAINYATMIDVPFAYSSNGDGFVEHDLTKTEGPLQREFGLNEFPTPDQLWQRYKAWKQITPEQERIITQPYFFGDKPPRYYQQAAINRTVEAIAKAKSASCSSWPPAPARPTPLFKSCIACGRHARPNAFSFWPIATS
jgi:type I restriction enzyme, R subunit